MSEIQYKSRFTNRFDVNLDGIYALDLPNGTYKMIDDAFKKWEIRHGFITEDQQKLGLRGRAYHYGQFRKRKEESEKKEAVKKIKPVKPCKKSASVTKKKTTTKLKSKKVASGKRAKKSARSISRKSRWWVDTSTGTLSSLQQDFMVEFYSSMPIKNPLQGAAFL